jgi:hypothetical protein
MRRPSTCRGSRRDRALPPAPRAALPARRPLPRVRERRCAPSRRAPSRRLEQLAARPGRARGGLGRAPGALHPRRLADARAPAKAAGGAIAALSALPIARGVAPLNEPAAGRPDLYVLVRPRARAAASRIHGLPILQTRVVVRRDRARARKGEIVTTAYTNPNARRCDAPASAFTLIHRPGDTCSRIATRTFGERAYCGWHADERLEAHRRVIARILAIPPRPLDAEPTLPPLPVYPLRWAGR